MDQQTLLNFGLVLIFVLIGGVFAATEMALVSLRPSQLDRLEQQGPRGAKVASLARDPNTFLAAVQIGVTVAGFLSAAYGASTLAPDFAHVFTRLGLSTNAAENIALVLMTLLIAYLSLVLGELVPKRFALQKSAGLATVVAPPLSRFASLMRPVIWFLSLSTNVVVRLLRGNPHATNEEMSEDELRDLVGGHEGLEDDERRIMQDVFAATKRTVKEVMQPRHSVDFLSGSASLVDASAAIQDQPHSRYPVTGASVDDVLGFVHVRDLLQSEADPGTLVGTLVRDIPVFPGTNRILPAMASMRREGVHIALVVDEYGGTDGIVTLEDMVEELVGEIRDEYDLPVEADDLRTAGLFDGGLNIEDFAEASGIELTDGPYETVAGFIVDRLGRLPVIDDSVQVENATLSVAGLDGFRISQIKVVRTEVDEA
ncbi:hemolysin family protein [Aeromicrobium sp.]|uniref:hemolysin family protein n=1 Tax=Aeromicrobium sp. TaxID=1871063 RepID=UPI002FCB4F7E